MMNRREALARLGALAATGWLGTKTALGAETTATTINTSATAAAHTGAMHGKPFSVAHITDVHVYDKLDAQKWLAECLGHIQSNPASPSLILNTGDCVMDTLKTDRSRADSLWKMWRSILKNENSLPIHHGLGNHDVFGLGLDAGHPAKADPMYGKKLALENLEMERSYYSFNHGDWHFIVLDSIHPTGGVDGSGWTAVLDDDQYNWLEADLRATPAHMPVTVYSHVSILTITSMRHQKPDEEGLYQLGSQGMLSDARRIIDLFDKHPNVKLCLSGHIHLRDRIELGGVTYICDGAVSGAWWKGPRLDCPPGYSIINYKPDGTFDYNYTDYGWKPNPLA